MEVLSHDVVEQILERLPMKSLIRFKSVSKQWNSTIESNNFQERFHRHQSRDVPDILFLTFPIDIKRNRYRDDDDDDDEPEEIPSSSLSSSSSSSLSLFDNDGKDNDIKIISSSLVTTLKFPIRDWFRCSASCDGLVCFYNGYKSITVFNPTTRWHRTLPPSNLQQEQRRSQSLRRFSMLGFGQDKFNGTYKLVWLYHNKREFGKDTSWRYVTTCEVFDFSTNAWRYVTLAEPYTILLYVDPVNIDGSLHWFTTDNEFKTQVLSFDLHNETFQVMAKAPFEYDHLRGLHYEMCNVNNRLCVSETKWPNQKIWLFDSGTKTWNHMHSIDLERTYSWFRKSITRDQKWIKYDRIQSLKPLAVLEGKNTKKTKVWFYFSIHEEPGRYFVVYDSQTESYDLAFTFKPFGSGYPVCYFPSLISI